MVFQQFNLFPHMTVLENCMLAPMRSRGAPRAQAEDTARRLLDRVKILNQAEKYPAQLSGGRMWYLRSYTRSPIHVEFPTANQPMRVVYWARWADAQGNVGPFCQSVVARVEGWDGGGRALPSFMEGRERQQRIVITSAMKQLPEYTQDAEDADETKMLPEAA